jgi:predicted ribosomally synthesized peptide with SipW-like signal peptide
MTQHLAPQYSDKQTIGIDEPAKKRRRSRMVRAILAGGLVLGVGAAVTLAAWNDSEFVTGTFTAGSFNMQGSTTDGTTFIDHPVGSPGALTFTVAPTLMSPGDTVYAPFALRLAANTTNNANVVITAPNTTTGVVTNLTYEVVRTTAFTCAAGTVDSTGTSLITAGTAMTAVAGPNTFVLNHGTPVTAVGATQFLCFKVTAGAGLTQGQTGSVTWQFTASSI